MRIVAWPVNFFAFVLFALLTNSTVPALAQNPFANVSGTQRLLIIAPDEFMAALQPLVQHKNQTGLSAVAVSISSLSPFFKGADDPETVKHAIQYAHEKLNTQYVMLVGDAQKFPVRFQFMHNLGIYYPFSQQLSDQTWSVPSDWPNAVLNNLSPTGYSLATEPVMDAGSGMVDGTYIPSDLYYANLYHHPLPPNGAPGVFDNWDANNNGLYNEGSWVNPANPNPDNVDGEPDVAVGRVPAHTAADVQAYVSKIISYESTTPNVKFTFVGDYAYGPPSQSGTYSESFYLTQGAVGGSGFAASPANTNAVYGLIEVPLPQPGTLVSVPPNWLSLSPDDVAAYAKQSTWLSYIGHGGNQVWGYDGVFGVSNVAETAQNSALPVVFVAGCSTGSFINEPPWNLEYADAAGVAHTFQAAWPEATAGNPNVAIISDLSTGKVWGGPSSPNTNPLPLTTPKPNPYDLIGNRMDQSFAYSWLIGSAPGGAIAYFGETGVASDGMAGELETSLLKYYLATPNPILGDLYLSAQQDYFSNHRNDNGSDDGDFHSIPRFYLGWLMLFGDPSLRLPNLISATAQPKVTSVKPSTGSDLGGTQVTIEGADFSWPGGTQITFAGVPASAVSCSSATECTAKSPPYKLGAAAYTVDVQAAITPLAVQSAAKTLTSAANSADHFTYPAGPKCLWTEICAQQNAMYPSLNVSCSTKANFVDTHGRRTAGLTSSFPMSDSHASVLACDPQTDSCVWHDIYQQPYIYCRTGDFCTNCVRTGGTCSRATPTSPQTCIHQ